MESPTPCHLNWTTLCPKKNNFGSTDWTYALTGSHQWQSTAACMFYFISKKKFPKTNTLGKKNKAGLPFGEVDSLFLICFLLQIFWPVGILSNKALYYFLLFFGMRNKTKQKQTILVRGCLSIEVASLVIALISQSFFSS